MRILPRSVTWLVDPDHPRRRLCLEAASPQRAAAFRRRCPGAVSLHLAWGLAPDGHALSERERRNLRNGIYRALRRAGEPGTSAVSRHQDALTLIYQMARQEGCDVADLLRPRSRRHARVRGFACHRLRDELNLSLSHIAEILGYRDHTSVAYWLDQPRDTILATPNRVIMIDEQTPQRHCKMAVCR